MPPAFAGMFINLIPVFGLAVSYAFLDERMTARQWLGAAAILSAVVTVARRQTTVHPTDSGEVASDVARSSQPIGRQGRPSS